MLNIYLARHGQDEDNVKGILNGRRDKSLTKLGKEQAKELGTRIKRMGVSFEIVYTSPLKRAYKTAEIASDILGIDKPEIMEELIERDFGIMTGKSVNDIKKHCSPNILKTETVTYFLSPEGAETFPDLIKRGMTVLQKLDKKHKSGNILLVSHGDIGKMIYAAYYNLDWKKFLPKFHFGNSDLLVMSKSTTAEDSHIVNTMQYNL